MDNPSIRTTGLSSASDDGGSASASSASSASSDITPTRKSLHQKILGKLRPLPFQYHWAVWYEKHSEAGVDFHDKLSILHEDVADIGTFYRVYNNFPWDKVRLRDTVHIFRKGTKPVWEDPENVNGGAWTFRVPKAKSQAFFHEMAILCIANELQTALEAGTPKFCDNHIINPHKEANMEHTYDVEHDHVLGISMSVRFNSHLISVWNKCGSNPTAIEALEKIILERLSPDLRPTGPTRSYFYKRHDEHEGFQAAVASSQENQAVDKLSTPASISVRVSEAE